MPVTVPIVLVGHNIDKRWTYTYNIFMTDVNDGTKKRTLHRSPAYPSIDLEKAIPLVVRLNEKFSDDVFSRDNAATELGLQKGGDAFRKIAALSHFGLISRKGSSYKVAPLAKQIIFPGDDDNVKQNAIRDAVKNPTLYRALIISYQGKQLPTALYHRLITTERFNQSVAEKVAKDFKKSVEFAGILKNGIIVDSEDGNIPQGIKFEPQDLPAKESDEPKFREPMIDRSIDGVSLQLGPNIIVTLSGNIMRDIAMGKFGDRFAKALEALDKLGKGEEDGTSTDNASSTPVESN